MNDYLNVKQRVEMANSMNVSAFGILQPHESPE